MMCEACARDDHAACGMQTWCECDCDPEMVRVMPEFDPYAVDDRQLTLDLPV